MIVDVSDAFSGLTETITVETTPGSYANGRWVSGLPVVTTIQGVLQNVTPTDLKVLPEGERDVTAIKIHSVDSVSTGDLIKYLGSDWKVYNVAVRAIGNYSKIIAIKE